MKDRQRTN